MVAACIGWPWACFLFTRFSICSQSSKNMGFEIVGQAWDVEAFEGYISDISLGWADSVTIHHTAAPSLAQRPDGFTLQHMRNIAHYYQTQLGWSASPHLFTDEDEVYGMSSLWRRGIHARSFNSHSIGIEMLGNYDSESPSSGRGLDVIETTAQVVAALLTRMKLLATDKTILFHRDDPKTSKTCPGSLINKGWFVGKVQSYMGATQPLTIEQRLARIEEHLNI